MRFRGTTLAVGGLLLGVVIGIAIQVTQRVAARALTELLDSEARAACDGCRFVAEEFDVSLLTLRAVARNARIEEHGVPAFSVRELRGRFGLGDILERVARLEELQLLDAAISGALPESVAYRFIYQLAKPVPPERDRPDRWRVRLFRLTLSNATIAEQLGGLPLTITGGQLVVQRTPDNQFYFTPQIDRITFPLLSSHAQVFGDIYAHDDFVRAGPLLMTWGQSRLRTMVEIPSRASTPLSGGIEGTVSLGDVATTRAITAEPHPLLGVTATAGGTIDAPSASFSTRLRDAPLTTEAPGVGTITLEDVQLQGTVSVGSDGLPIVSLGRLSIRGTPLTIEGITPIDLLGEQISGSLRISSPGLPVAQRSGVTLEPWEATLSLAGTLSKPRLQARGLLQGLRGGTVVTPPITFAVDGSTEGLTLETSGAIHAKVVATSSEQGMSLATLELRSEPIPLHPSVTVAVDLRASRSGGVLRGKGTISASTPLGKLHGPLEITPRESMVTLQGNNLTVTLRRNDRLVVDITASEYPLTHPVRGAVGAVSVAGTLTGDPNSLGDLAGTITISRLTLGGENARLSLATPASVTLSGCDLSLPTAILSGIGSTVTVRGSHRCSGELEGRAHGTVQLEALLPFVPMLDDLAGEATLDLTASGTIDRPQVEGAAQLRGMRVESAALDLTVADLSGGIALSGSRLRADNIRGRLNDGALTLGANLDLLQPEQGTFSISVEGLSLTPLPGLDAIVSGSISLTPESGAAPLIRGSILVEQALFERSIDLLTLVRAVQRLFATSGEATVAVSSASNVPPWRLNVEVMAPRDLRVVTNLLSAELSSSLVVQGTLREPKLTGEVATLSGWVRVQDRRFEITSGEVSFRPGAAPRLTALAEAYVFSREGDNVLVLIEIDGPLDSPRVTFSSDRGLPQREILRLLASGTTVGGQRFSMTRSEAPGSFAEDLIDFGSPFRVLRNLIRFDSLTVEPAWNRISGGIEPLLIAEKRLSERITLRGESSLGSTGQQARARLLTPLSDRVLLSGGISAADAQTSSALEADLSYVVFRRDVPFVTLQLSGNDFFADRELLSAVRLNESSRIRPDDLSRIERDLEAAYQKAGFFETVAAGSCHADGKFCRSVHISVVEGTRRDIKEIVLEGVDRESSLVTTTLREFTSWEGQPAEHEKLRELQQHLTRIVRREGYLGARITTSYRLLDNDQATLVADITLGRPLTFVFSGNTLFTGEEFLEAINLFDRPQPFGANTGTVLQSTIERLYRSKGFLFASTKFSRDDVSVPGRSIVRISIDEGSSVAVSHVELRGEDFTEELERELLARFTPSERANLLRPRFAIEEQVTRMTELLTEHLVELGFPSVIVRSEIIPAEDAASALLRYHLSLGPRQRIVGLTRIGLDEQIAQAFPAPGLPTTFPELNRHIETLIGALRDRGFLRPQAVTTLTDSEAIVQLEFSTGPQVRIRSVILEGGEAVEPTLLTDIVTIRAGDPWDRGQLDALRRRLLTQGLFSRVDIEPRDGAIDEPEEDLVIRLLTRPLRTLEVGVGANSELGVHLFGEGTDRSLFRDGRSLAMRVDLYVDPGSREVNEGIASLQYSVPQVLQSELRLTNDLRYQRLELPHQEFDLDRFVLGTLFSPLERDAISVGFGHTLALNRLDSVTPGAILSPLDTGDYRSSSLTAEFAYDRRDDPLNPRQGFLLSVTSELATDVIGSESSFSLVDTRGSFLVPLGDSISRWTLASFGRVGIATPFGSTDEIPINSRFYAGGRSTVRGYQELSLGPRGADGAVIGGDALTIASLELQYRALENLSLSTFIDSGTVFRRDRSMSSDDLRYSVGVGVRFLSPVGPIGFDLGYPLEREPGESEFRAHFAIGSAF